MRRPTVVLGLLGVQLDSGLSENRWEKWRPSVALCQFDDLIVDRFVLLHEPKHQNLVRTVAADIHHVSPETKVESHLIDIADPWDFGEVYSSLFAFARSFAFQPETEDYLVHITTGTHVAQICLFLLTEGRHFPARLLQTAPPSRREKSPGSHTIIDLDLSRYDAIARRFAIEREAGAQVLKSGIKTKNPRFNALIDQIEHVALHTEAPILLMGPTGAGKSRLAARIFDLKKQRHHLRGPFVEVNCATIRGDAAMSALFGHAKGAFTGASSDRPGLLRTADGGVLFLDEIGELGQDEQAMLLRALEEKRFLPVGRDQEVASNFQLIAGTNQDLRHRARVSQFRDDLLARINLWTFEIPGLLERPEDLEPNLDYELDRYAERTGRRITFNREARQRYLQFATSKSATWSSNFRDLNASVTRLATLAAGGRIDEPTVDQEIHRLLRDWSPPPAPSQTSASDDEDFLTSILGDRLAHIDLFDRVQLVPVLRLCRTTKSLSEAGRLLFQSSRTQKSSTNDADRLRKYLARFDLHFNNL